MRETINELKGILKILLYAGSVACWLIGLRELYGMITSFRATERDWLYELVLAVVFICLAFAPAFMLLLGLKTRAWHWAFMFIAETMVIALAVYTVHVNYVRA